MAFRTGLSAIAAALALAACGGGQGDSPAGESSAADGAAPGGEVAGEAASSVAPASGAATGAVSGEAQGDTGGLSAYVGKFPFDKVGSMTWDENPTVQAGIRETVKDAAARKAILETQGPSAPIELIDGKVSAWSCEQHNCGPHQWMVMVDPASGDTDVCYYDEAADGANSRWFLASGREETRPGNCQVE